MMLRRRVGSSYARNAAPNEMKNGMAPSWCESSPLTNCPSRPRPKPTVAVSARMPAIAAATRSRWNDRVKYATATGSAAIVPIASTLIAPEFDSVPNVHARG